MEIDNIGQILSYLIFKENEGYIVYVFERPKDNGVIFSYSWQRDISLIKDSFVIKDKEDLLNIIDTLKSECIKYNARAYITTTRRVVGDLRGKIDTNTFVKIYDGVSEEKVTIYDVDGEYRHKTNQILDRIQDFDFKLKNTIVLPTPNGHHILTRAVIPYKKIWYNFPGLFMSFMDGTILYCNLREVK